MCPERFTATVVIPTHSHHETLDLAVASALAQTADGVEVIVVGDGVTSEVRDVAQGLVRGDAGRIRFLDLPKGANHGEMYRERAIDEARSDAIFYLCDDDLLWPEHVANLLELLADHDLVHSMNGYFTHDREFVPYFSDLASTDFRRMLLHPQRNAVSLTGAAHTVAAYRRLSVGWETTPAGRWPDHFMWQKFLALPELRAATAGAVSTVQLPSGLEDRSNWSAGRRRTELSAWAGALADPASRAVVAATVLVGMNREGAALWMQWHAVSDVAESLQVSVHDLMSTLAVAEGERSQLDEKRRRLETDAAHAAARYAQLWLDHGFRSAELAAIRGSRTWRARERLLRNDSIRALARALLRPAQ